MPNNSYPNVIPPHQEECNTSIDALPGHQRDYNKREARQGRAIADALIQAGIGGGLPAGTRTEYTHTATNVSTEIVPADPARTYFVMQNLSGETLRVRFGGAPSTTEGYIVCPGSLLESRISEQVTESINVLSTAANSPIYGFYLA